MLPPFCRRDIWMYQLPQSESMQRQTQLHVRIWCFRAQSWCNQEWLLIHMDWSQGWYFVGGKVSYWSGRAQVSEEKVLISLNQFQSCSTRNNAFTVTIPDRCTGCQIIFPTDHYFTKKF